MEIKKILMLGNSGAGKKTALQTYCNNLKKLLLQVMERTIINNKKLQIISPSRARQI
jgi:ribose 1,5-bisphosphokinase PhnN